MRRLLLPLMLALALPAAAQESDLDRQIEKLRGELVKLGAQEQAGEGTAIGQRARLVALNAQEAALKARIEANRGDLSKLLAALQTYQRRPPPPLLVNPRSARDAVRAAILIRAITPQLEARGRAFAVQAEAIAKVRRSAAAASETLFQAESDIADRRAAEGLGFGGDRERRRRPAPRPGGHGDHLGRDRPLGRGGRASGPPRSRGRWRQDAARALSRSARRRRGAQSLALAQDRRPESGHGPEFGRNFRATLSAQCVIWHEAASVIR